MTGFAFNFGQFFLAFLQRCFHACGRPGTAHSRRGGQLANLPETMDFRKAAKENTKELGNFGCCLRWAMPNRRILVNFGPGFGAIRVAKSGPHSLQRPPLEFFFQKIFGSLGTQVRSLEPIFSFFILLKFLRPACRKLGSWTGNRPRGRHSCHSG